MCTIVRATVPFTSARKIIVGSIACGSERSSPPSWPPSFRTGRCGFEFRPHGNKLVVRDDVTRVGRAGLPGLERNIVPAVKDSRAYKPPRSYLQSLISHRFQLSEHRCPGRKAAQI